MRKRTLSPRKKRVRPVRSQRNEVEEVINSRGLTGTAED